MASLQKHTPALPAGETPEGPVTFPDSSKLDRRQRLSAKSYILVVTAMAGAIALGGVGMNFAYKEIVLGPELELERTEQAISADVAYHIPLLVDYVNLTDAEMEAALVDEGFTLYMLTPYAENPEDTEIWDCYRVVPGLSDSTVKSYLEQGLGNIKKSQSATFLNGSWRWTVYRYLTCAVRLQYADFNAKDPQTAIINALKTQGWNNPETFTESGVDDNGNTFQAGILTQDGKRYSWRVSTVTLKEMYDVEYPGGGMFVGIRLTQIID